MEIIQDTSGHFRFVPEMPPECREKIKSPCCPSDTPMSIGMSMLAMEQCERIAEFVVVARPSDQDAIRQTIADLQLKKCSAIVSGGATRQESVINGIRAAAKETKLFAIHDGARPLVKPEQIAKVIRDASVFGGATLGVPVKDTIKVVNDGLIVDTPYRPHLYMTQTPQVFQKRILF